MISLARSRDRSADMKQLRPLSAIPASYWFCEFKSLRIILVANISSYNVKNKTKSERWIKPERWTKHWFSEKLSDVNEIELNRGVIRG